MTDTNVLEVTKLIRYYLMRFKIKPCLWEDIQQNILALLFTKWEVYNLGEDTYKIRNIIIWSIKKELKLLINHNNQFIDIEENSRDFTIEDIVEDPSAAAVIDNNILEIDFIAAFSKYLIDDLEYKVAMDLWNYTDRKDILIKNNITLSEFNSIQKRIKRKLLKDPLIKEVYEASINRFDIWGCTFRTSPEKVAFLINNNNWGV